MQERRSRESNIVFKSIARYLEERKREKIRKRDSERYKEREIVRDRERERWR